MPSDYFGEDAREEKRSRRSHRHHSDSHERHEQELKDFLSDETSMAREVLSLKRELGRLHYKVKSYQQKNHSMQIIFGVTILVLLLIIAYGIYFEG